MKYKIVSIFGLFVVAAFLFSACTKSEIQKAQEAYDYNTIIPKVMEIYGPTSVAAHGLADFPYEYSAPARGGSSWAWEVETQLGTGTPEITLEENGRIAKIVFPQRSEADTATVKVIETTAGGKSSEQQTMEVALAAFCPYLWDDYEGNYTGTSGAHSDPVVFERTTTLNQFRVYGLANFVNSDWGENWVEGDGSCIGSFSCGDIFTIAKQEIGDTDYPDTYVLEGSGTVDPVTKIITLDYEVWYDAGGSSAGTFSTVLTPAGAGLKVLITPEPFNRKK